MAEESPLTYARTLLDILHRDGDRLERIDNYNRGHHDDPYLPPNADHEYVALAKRARSNWMPLVVSAPAQAMYVDDYRAGDGSPSVARAAMLHWQKSRLDARQAAVHRGALIFGHSFTVTEMRRGKAHTRGLSAKTTAALFEDPANDDAPVVALTVTRQPNGDIRGKATMWDETNKYAVTFKSLADGNSVTIVDEGEHGLSECPVTRFVAAVDLEGRTVGVVEPMIPLQDRINQTVFDLLVTQTYASFKVRWATGMAPPLERDADGDVVLDEKGQPKPLPLNHNAKRFLFAEDPEARFGTLDETPLSGFIESIDMSIRHLAAISQTPPHHLLGQIANLSAEALLAAETSLSRKVEEFRTSFGESWERVFRLAAELNKEDVVDDYAGEVLWRDLENRSLAQSADALGKLAEMLGIPKRALWSRVPGVTATEREQWEDMAESDPDNVMAAALARATPAYDDFPLDDPLPDPAVA